MEIKFRPNGNNDSIYLQVKDEIMEILLLYTVVQSHCNRKDDET